MFAAAYFFKDYNHMTSVLNGPIGKKIADDLAKKVGVRPLGAYYLGTRNLNLRDIGRKVMVPDDLKGVKLRMPNSPSWLFMGRALGANPTPISITELYMALKTGTVDGQDNPVPGTIKRKFYEVTKYYILTGHYVNPIMPVINEKKWQSLGADLQEKVYQAIRKAQEYCDQENLKVEKEGLDFLRKQGITVYSVDKNVWSKHVLNYYLQDKKMTGNWDMNLYKEVQAAAE
jgi:tripartite ATP-independent transporter DctP family solute receptor